MKMFAVSATPELKLAVDGLIVRHMAEALRLIPAVDLQDEAACRQRLEDEGFGQASINVLIARARTEAAR
jgi:hypothetical protein